MSRIRVRLRRASDNAPFPAMTAAIRAMNNITEASRDGLALRLSAEEVRALHWCVHGVTECDVPDDWRDHAPEGASS